MGTLGGDRPGNTIGGDAVSSPPLTYAALRRVPAVALACDAVHQGRLGRRLAVYGSVRTKECTPADFDTLSLPVIALMLDALQEHPVTIAASEVSVRAGMPAWVIVLRFASGLVGTLDIGSLLPESFPVDTEVRLEFLGTEEALLIEPDALSVRVYSAQRIQHTRCDVPAESYLDQKPGELPPAASAEAERVARRVLDAAHRALSSGQPAHV